MKRNNKKGFTIVELVIVIGVIAILSAVLIPTFSGVTKDAKDAANKAEARNQYTQFMSDIDNVDKHVDYVKLVDDEDNATYYDVANGFELVKEADVHGYVISGADNSEPTLEGCADQTTCPTHKPAN